MFRRLWRGSRLMPNVLKVYIWEADAQVKRAIFDERSRGDSSKPRLERVVVGGDGKRRRGSGYF